MIIAVDFDGTLCENKWPEIGDPYPGVIAFCLGQRMTGSKLILWTCRQGKELQAAIDWCRQFHLTFDAVNENLPEHIAAFGGDTRKVYADMYIDDKSEKIDMVDFVGRHCYRQMRDLFGICFDRSDDADLGRC